MKKFICRYDKKRVFKTQEEQIAHERNCPFKEKSGKKQCRYDCSHVFPINQIAEHEKNCPTRKKMMKDLKEIEKKYESSKREIEKIENEDTKIEDNNNNDNITINKLENNKNLRVIKFNECFGEEDYIFKKVYID